LIAGFQGFGNFSQLLVVSGEMQTIPKEHDSAVGYLHNVEVGSASECMMPPLSMTATKIIM
jgi:hypothetical protein